MNDLPLCLQESLARFFASGRRAYAAWHPNFEGCLKVKNAEGLADWQSRTWQRFGGEKPTIVDVSDALVDLWREVVQHGPDPSKRLKIVLQPPATLGLRCGALLDHDIQLEGG